MIYEISLFILILNNFNLFYIFIFYCVIFANNLPKATTWDRLRKGTMKQSLSKGGTASPLRFPLLCGEEMWDKTCLR